MSIKGFEEKKGSRLFSYLLEPESGCLTLLRCELWDRSVGIYQSGAFSWAALVNGMIFWFLVSTYLVGIHSIFSESNWWPW
jgi:hypothetical protein